MSSVSINGSIPARSLEKYEYIEEIMKKRISYKATVKAKSKF
jgi:hypothetical protein